jgi:peptidoglycan/LPS O-acetylase OafA/YrhL
MILVGGALTDRLHGWRPPAILALLGDASYVLYLVHSPAISVMAIINHKLAKHIIIPPHLLYFIVIVGATIAGIIAHLIVEKPLLKWMRRLTESKAQRQARMVEQA